MEIALKELVKYVMDPMFQEAPTPLDIYVKNISVENAIPKTTYEIVPQTYELDFASAESYSAIPQSIKSCQYDLVQLQKNQNILQKNLDTALPSQRIKFPSWERAKYAYQFFYQSQTSRVQKPSEDQLDDIKQTVNNLPERIRDSRLQIIRSLTDK